MTLEELEGVRVRIQGQYDRLLSTPVEDEKAVVKHMNAIECCAALKVMDQLIGQEQGKRYAPPGATGPVL